MTTPIIIDSEVFTNRFLDTLYVPEGCKAAYEAAEYWQDFKEIIEVTDVPDAELTLYTNKVETRANSQATIPLPLRTSLSRTPTAKSTSPML